MTGCSLFDYKLEATKFSSWGWTNGIYSEKYLIEQAVESKICIVIKSYQCDESSMF